MYEKRVYRELFKGQNLVFFNVCVLETDLSIGANKLLFNEAYEAVKKYRNQICMYIDKAPEFISSLKPIEYCIDAPDIIKNMCIASKKAGVGPFASVAGGISELVGKILCKYSNEVIVENGGDIFIKTNIPRKVGIFAGKSSLSNKIAIKVSPADTPIGICTSAGTVGHSLSFGNADAVVVISKDTFLADAVATATGNIVKTCNDIEEALEFAYSIEGVDGVVIIVGSKIGSIGKVELSKF